MLDFTKTRKKLISWYDVNKRDLPWRQTSDPYCIWISEIILQQTRVNQGLDYYLKFVKRFPNVTILANSDLDEVLKYWQGLGYYSRARNLHIAAKQIVESYNGRFPDKYDSILNLKGVGKYTANAIASIAFGIPVPVVDGNVFRVISRYTGNKTPIDSKNAYTLYYNIAEKMMGNANPSSFNQAMMELGALVCSTKSPKCDECPLNYNCIAKQKKTTNLFPIKTKIIKIKDRYFYYLVISINNNLVMHKRTEKDIWHSMYDFPLIETSEKKNIDEIISSKSFEAFTNTKNIVIKDIIGPVKHQLTHQTIYTTFIRIIVDKKSKKIPTSYLLVDMKKIIKMAVPRVIEKYLELEFDIKK
jgi:A/G-specific adenine glycosylase